MSTNLLLCQTCKNGTISVEDWTKPTWRISLEVVFLSMILLVSLVGNVLVIAVILRSQRSSELANLYVGNLATANLTVPIICVPLLIFSSINSFWPFGESSCKLAQFALFLNASVSLFMLSCMVLERLFVIVYPLSVLLTREESIRLIFFAWFSMPLITCPIWYFARIVQSSNKKSCTVGGKAELWMAYILLFCLAGIFVPFIFVNIVNLKIILAIRQRNTFSKRSMRYKACGHISNQTIEERSISCPKKLAKSKDAQNIDFRGLGKVPATKQKTAKMLIIQNMLYFLCWLPYFLWLLWLSSGQNKDIYSLHIAFVYLCITNSALNPILYALFNSNFRRGIRHMMRIDVGSRYNVTALFRKKNQVDVQLSHMHKSHTFRKDSKESVKSKRDSLFGIKLAQGAQTMKNAIENAPSVARREAWTL